MAYPVAAVAAPAGLAAAAAAGLAAAAATGAATGYISFGGGRFGRSASGPPGRI